MPRESRGDVVLDLEQLAAAYRANPTAIPGLEPLVQEIETLVPEIRALGVQQAAQRAVVQQTTKEIKERVDRAKLAASRLRNGAKAIFGTRTEKVIEFGLRPFRKPVRAPKIIEVQAPATKETATQTTETTKPTS